MEEIGENYGLRLAETPPATRSQQHMPTSGSDDYKSCSSEEAIYSLDCASYFATLHYAEENYVSESFFEDIEENEKASSMIPLEEDETICLSLDEISSLNDDCYFEHCAVQIGPLIGLAKEVYGELAHMHRPTRGWYDDACVEYQPLQVEVSHGAFRDLQNNQTITHYEEHYYVEEKKADFMKKMYMRCSAYKGMTVKDLVSKFTPGAKEYCPNCKRLIEDCGCCHKVDAQSHATSKKAVLKNKFATREKVIIIVDESKRSDFKKPGVKTNSRYTTDISKLRDYVHKFKEKEDKWIFWCPLYSEVYEGEGDHVTWWQGLVKDYVKPHQPYCVLKNQEGALRALDYLFTEGFLEVIMSGGLGIRDAVASYCKKAKSGKMPLATPTQILRSDSLVYRKSTAHMFASIVTSFSDIDFDFRCTDKSLARLQLGMCKEYPVTWWIFSKKGYVEAQSNPDGTPTWWKDPRKVTAQLEEDETLIATCFKTISGLLSPMLNKVISMFGTDGCLSKVIKTVLEWTAPGVAMIYQAYELVHSFFSDHPYLTALFFGLIAIGLVSAIALGCSTTYQVAISLVAAIFPALGLYTFAVSPNVMAQVDFEAFTYLTWLVTSVTGASNDKVSKHMSGLRSYSSGKQILADLQSLIPDLWNSIWYFAFNEDYYPSMEVKRQMKELQTEYDDVMTKHPDFIQSVRLSEELAAWYVSWFDKYNGKVQSVLASLSDDVTRRTLEARIKNYRALRKEVNSVRPSALSKPKPVTILMKAANAGVGKSELVRIMALWAYTNIREKFPNIFTQDWVHTMVFGKPYTSDYYDGYQAGITWAIVVEEFLNCTNLIERTAASRDFLQLADDKPYCVDMSKTEDKGYTYMTPRMVFATCPLSPAEFSLANGLAQIGALERRIDLVIEPIPRLVDGKKLKFDLGTYHPDHLWEFRVTRSIEGQPCKATHQNVQDGFWTFMEIMQYITNELVENCTMKTSSDVLKWRTLVPPISTFGVPGTNLDTTITTTTTAQGSYWDKYAPKWLKRSVRPTENLTSDSTSLWNQMWWGLGYVGPDADFTSELDAKFTCSEINKKIHDPLMVAHTTIDHRTYLHHIEIWRTANPDFDNPDKVYLAHLPYYPLTPRSNVSFDSGSQYRLRSCLEEGLHVLGVHGIYNVVSEEEKLYLKRLRGSYEESVNTSSWYVPILTRVLSELNFHPRAFVYLCSQINEDFQPLRAWDCEFFYEPKNFLYLMALYAYFKTYVARFFSRVWRDIYLHMIQSIGLDLYDTSWQSTPEARVAFSIMCSAAYTEDCPISRIAFTSSTYSVASTGFFECVNLVPSVDNMWKSPGDLLEEDFLDFEVVAMGNTLLGRRVKVEYGIEPILEIRNIRTVMQKYKAEGFTTGCAWSSIKHTLWRATPWAIVGSFAAILGYGLHKLMNPIGPVLKDEKEESRTVKNFFANYSVKSNVLEIRLMGSFPTDKVVWFMNLDRPNGYKAVMDIVQTRQLTDFQSVTVVMDETATVLVTYKHISGTGFSKEIKKDVGSSHSLSYMPSDVYKVTPSHSLSNMPSDVFKTTPSHSLSTCHEMAVTEGYDPCYCDIDAIPFRVFSQGMNDMAESINDQKYNRLAKVQDNIYDIWVYSASGRASQARTFTIGSYLFYVNRHMLDRYEDWTHMEIMTADKGHGVVIQRSEMEIRVFKDRDLALIKMPTRAPLCKSLVKRMKRVSDKTLPRSVIMLNRVVVNETTVKYTSRIMPFAPVMTTTTTYGSLESELRTAEGTVIRVNYSDYRLVPGASTVAGDCLQVYANYSDAMPVQDIEGVHVGASGTTGIYCPIYADDVEGFEILDIFQPGKLEKTMYHLTEAQLGDYEATVVPGLRVTREKLRQPPFIPTKTVFKRSLIYEELNQFLVMANNLDPVIPNFVDAAPADLRHHVHANTWKRFEETSVSPEIPKEIRRLLLNPELWNDFIVELKPVRFLSLEEALFSYNGMAGFDDSKSPTHDFSKFGLKRSDLYGIRDSPNEKWVVQGEFGDGLRWVNPLLRKAVNRCWAKMASGKLCLNRVTACWKDELRPLNRVQTGKTRLFCVSSFVLAVCTKMAIGDIVRQKDFMYANASKVGTNPYSADWKYLEDSCLTFLDSLIGGDGRGWDYSALTIWRAPFFKMLCQLPWVSAYYDTYGLRKMVVNILRSIAHSCIGYEMIYGFNVYLRDKSISSGNWATTFINTFINRCLHKLTYMRELKMHETNQFKKHIPLGCYGDDGIGSVHPDFVGRFDMYAIAQTFHDVGMEYTTPDKDDVDTPYLKEVSFLSRTFKKDYTAASITNAPLAMDSLLGQLAWVRDPSSLSGNTVQQQISQNMENVLRELVMWDKEKYLMFESFFLKMKSDHNLPVRINGWEFERHRYVSQYHH